MTKYLFYSSILQYDLIFENLYHYYIVDFLRQLHLLADMNSLVRVFLG